MKYTFEDLLPCYCYAIKPSDRTIRSQLSQPASAGKRADVSELQAHHCLTGGEWTWILCKLSVIPENKLSMQELNQLLGTLRRWHQFFHKFFILSPKFQVGQMPVLPPPCGRPCQLIVHNNTRFKQTKHTCNSSNWRNIFTSGVGCSIVPASVMQSYSRE